MSHTLGSDFQEQQRGQDLIPQRVHQFSWLKLLKNGEPKLHSGLSWQYRQRKSNGLMGPYDIDNI